MTVLAVYLGLMIGMIASSLFGNKDSDHNKWVNDNYHKPHLARVILNKILGPIYLTVSLMLAIKILSAGGDEHDCLSATCEMLSYKRK